LITVLAGVNGAGKSSIGGSALHAEGQDWYNPDALAREVHAQFPDRPLDEINSQVWYQGLSRLKTAIRDDTNFAFETTLGGNTITNTLLKAIASGVPVNIWYCSLGSPELHIKRVKARVARGGHDIPEYLIHLRYKTSMQNLCLLATGLHQLAVYDNSQPLGRDGKPNIRLLLHFENDKIKQLDRCMPEWAKPVAAVCLQRVSGK
jgi:predicted ABC-type ATPase